MTLDLSTIHQIHIACGYTDMRKSIDGLAAVVLEQFKMNPFERNLFLFCGRRRNRFKALLWDENWFLLLYKRIEDGRFCWPTCDDDVRELSIHNAEQINLFDEAEAEAKTGTPEPVLDETKVTAHKRRKKTTWTPTGNIKFIAT